MKRKDRPLPFSRVSLSGGLFLSSPFLLRVYILCEVSGSGTRRGEGKSSRDELSVDCFVIFLHPPAWLPGAVATTTTTTAPALS